MDNRGPGSVSKIQPAQPPITNMGLRRDRERTAKAPLIRHIINQQYSHGAPVVSCRDGPKSFLTCCVPYLQLDTLAVEVYCANLEVDTDCSNVGLSEIVF